MKLDRNLVFEKMIIKLISIWGKFKSTIINWFAWAPPHHTVLVSHYVSLKFEQFNYSHSGSDKTDQINALPVCFIFSLLLKHAQLIQPWANSFPFCNKAGKYKIESS